MAQPALKIAPAVTDPVTAIQAELTEIRDELSALDDDYRATRVRIDDRVRRLTDMAGKLEFREGRVEAKTRIRVRKAADPHVQAGPKNLAIVVDLFRERGTLTQADVSKLGKISSGTTTHAIKALTLDKVIVPTGKTVGRSREFKLRSKVTRREPGQS